MTADQGTNQGQAQLWPMDSILGFSLLLHRVRIGTIIGPTRRVPQHMREESWNKQFLQWVHTVLSVKTATN